MKTKTALLEKREIHAPQSAIRLLVIDDHMVVRAGLSMLTNHSQAFVVVGEASNKVEALALKVVCDMIVLDLDLDGESGLELIPDLFKRHPESKILILTGSRDRELARLAIAAGAMGIVLKVHAFEVLLKAIERVHLGELWIDHMLTTSVISGLRKTNTPEIDPQTLKIVLLTSREREVIALIGEGLKNKAIADRLFLSETTVRHNLTSIFSRLGVTDRLELVIYAYRHGLVKPLSLESVAPKDSLNGRTFINPDAPPSIGNTKTEDAENCMEELADSE